MFEAIKIRIFGSQPTPSVKDNKLEQLIQREYPSKAFEVKQKLKRIKSDSREGKNRISACILKLSNKDFNKIEFYIDMSHIDFRDVILQAEYPRCLKNGFNNKGQNLKNIYLDDWIEYSIWLDK
jgi:hypothetical protein